MEPHAIAGRYHVQRPLGSGGRGIVWLCRDELLGLDVAIKQVATPAGQDAAALVRALREARFSEVLNHRNVVSIYNAVQDGDQTWLVMEYVRSRSLSRILAEDGPMPPERAVWITAQVADGLAAAHARGTIHRDVKPGNVLVKENELAKIGDFGISHTHGHPQPTQTRPVVGKTPYSSPELARGEEPTPAADVWALGATLYEAVGGHPPYLEQPKPVAMVTTIAAGQSLPPEHAGFLTEPIGRMLDPDPRSRWSMAYASDALHQLADEHPRRDTGQATTAFAVPAGVPAAQITDAAVGEPDPLPVATPDETWAGDSRSDPGDRDGRKGGAGRIVLLVAVILLALLTVAGLILLTDR